jgi:DNA-binding XRE family transcriptional regulator
MSEEPEFITYTREEFLEEFVHPDDRGYLEEVREGRALKVRPDSLTEMRHDAGLTQAEVAEAMGVSQQRVSAIESGSVSSLATLAEYVRALGGELKVIADFGNSWRQVA